MTAIEGRFSNGLRAIGGRFSRRGTSGVALCLAVAAATISVACEPVPTQYPLGPVVDPGGIAGFSWRRIASAQGGYVSYLAELDTNASSTGPRVLLIPGGGGQITVGFEQLAVRLADRGLRPIIACIGTNGTHFQGGPGMVTCQGTPTAAPAHVIAGANANEAVRAVESEYPSVIDNPQELVVLGVSYGGAAALHAASIGQWRHPVVTAAGTNTWTSVPPPAVPAGDVDPASRVVIDRIKAPVTQVYGTADALVPPGVATAFAAAAAPKVRVTSTRVVGLTHTDLGDSVSSPREDCVSAVLADALVAASSNRAAVSVPNRWRGPPRQVVEVTC